MKKTVIFALGVYATATAGIPAPQYGMNGGYGYPMGGGMGGGGNMGPMMGNGPMAGPYGMYGPYGGGPMYMPGGSGRNYNGNMRGQRYHAHAGADEWPLPKNPYKNARQNRYFANNAMYMNEGAGGSMMRASGHNRVPKNDNDDDSDSEENEKSESSSASINNSDADDSNGTHVGGVNRVSASAGSDAVHTSELLLEHSLMADSNTSLDLAMLSNKIINVNAFASSTGATPTHASAPEASATKAKSSAKARQTITRNISSSKPTPGTLRPKVNKETNAPSKANHVVRASSENIDPTSTVSLRSKIRATAATPAEPLTPTPSSHGHLQTAHTAPASKTVSEPSMKRIRGL